MSGFRIQSSLLDVDGNPLTVDIAEGRGSKPPVAPADVDAFTVNGPNGSNNQIWTAVPEPGSPGYFYLLSQQPARDGMALFLEVVDVSKPLMANPAPNSGSRNNQLWKIGLNPLTIPNVTAANFPPLFPQSPNAGVNVFKNALQNDYIVIESALTDPDGTPYVIDLQGWLPGDQPTKGNPLCAFKRKKSQNLNQCWMIVPSPSQIIPSDCAPNIVTLQPIIVLTNLAASTLRLEGNGALPGSTLCLASSYLIINQDGSNTLTQKMLVGAADFAGNFNVTYPLPTWGLPSDQVESPITPGTFTIVVFYNDCNFVDTGPGEPPITWASVTAAWDGAQFTDMAINNSPS